jgi:DUF4097 and DUF4098 domain-containing protein YvlB
MRITIAARSAAIEVDAGDADGVTVDGASFVTTPEGVEVHGRSSHVRVACPAGADVTVATASGRVAARGPLGEVHVSTRSGKVEVDVADRADIRTMSGSIRVGTVTGSCRCVAKSGRISIGAAGSVDVTSTSGSVEIGEVGDAEVTMMSGRVDLGTRRGTSVKVRTMSGTVRVRVPTDARPRTSLRAKVGKVQCDCPIGDDGEIDVKTLSGAIEVTCQQ